ARCSCHAAAIPFGCASLFVDSVVLSTACTATAEVKFVTAWGASMTGAAAAAALSAALSDCVVPDCELTSMVKASGSAAAVAVAALGALLLPASSAAVCVDSMELLFVSVPSGSRPSAKNCCHASGNV